MSSPFRTGIQTQQKMSLVRFLNADSIPALYKVEGDLAPDRPLEPQRVTNHMGRARPMRAAGDLHHAAAPVPLSASMMLVRPVPRAPLPICFFFVLFNSEASSGDAIAFWTLSQPHFFE